MTLAHKDLSGGVVTLTLKTFMRPRQQERAAGTRRIHEMPDSLIQREINLENKSSILYRQHSIRLGRARVPDFIRRRTRAHGPRHEMDSLGSKGFL